RVAEDFSTLLNLTQGRAMLGVGRGTGPLELQSLGMHQVSSGYLEEDSDTAINADDHNRKVFAEYMEIILKALNEVTFTHNGELFELPPPGVHSLDGGIAKELTLVPSPLYPFEVWQAITSPRTLEYVAKAGHGGVWWNQHHAFIKHFWNQYAQISEQNGTHLNPGEKRILALPIKIADSHEQAWQLGRPGHDEFWKLLGPFGWSRGYMGA